MDDHIKALEEERRKMVVFERELPLSLQLITQAIEMYKKQSKLEVSEEEGVPAVHFLEEFIPLRPSCSSSDEENNSHSHNDGGKVNGGINGDAVDTKKKEKPDWLKSAQLWNQQPEQAKGDDLRTPIAINAKRVGGAFHPFEREKIVNAASTSSTSNDNTNGGCGNGMSGEEKGKEKGGHSQGKARRCWSTELHRSFLNALQQLGGPHVATPKQIRELMKVDGLTNDEVKSHLQKYRLHNRSLSASPAVQANDDSSLQQPPQIVLVGSIWVQPPHVHATDASSNTAYFPVPSLPSQITSQQLQRQSKKKNCRSPTGPLNSERRSGDGGKSMKSGSSNTSSSTSQTTAASPL